MMGFVQRAWQHPVVRLLQVALVGLAGAWLGVYAWAGVKGDLKLVTVQASFQPAVRGGTRVDLPPFGSLWAPTHKGPLRLNLQLDRLHVKQATEWLDRSSTPEETAAYLEGEVRRVSSDLVRRTLIVALFGAVAASILFAVGWRYKLAGALIGVLGLAVPLGIAVHTYDKSAFANPQYEGELAHAPHLLDAAQHYYASAVENLPTITQQVVGLYRQLDANGHERGLSEQAHLHALLISDLHNNPLGMRFALSLAKSYEADLVLVCGDITDLGHPLEAELLTGWDQFGAPVVYVTGNHDSRSIADALAEVPGVTVLSDGEMTNAAGLSVMGFGDPAAERENTGSVDASAEDLDDLARQMIDALSGGENPPDIVMVHSFRVARSVAGHASLIVTGHSHSASVEEIKDTIVVNAGTTGATGLRYFTSSKDVPYTAAVLHFTVDDPGPRLSIVDMVELQQLSGDFVVGRNNIHTTDN